MIFEFFFFFLLPVFLNVGIEFASDVIMVFFDLVQSYRFRVSNQLYEKLKTDAYISGKMAPG